MSFRFLVLLSICVLVGCDTTGNLTPEEAFQEAKLAIDDGDGDRAMELYLFAAARDHLNAQLAYSRALQLGRVRSEPLKPFVLCRKDTAEARMWYDRAFELAQQRAENDDQSARLAFANMLIGDFDRTMGMGPDDVSEGDQAHGFRMLYELEAEGVAEAAHTLGIFALLKSQNPDDAISHFERAVELGHQFGYTQLAMAHVIKYQGDVEHGAVEQIRILSAGADANDDEATRELERILSTLDSTRDSGNEQAAEILDRLEAEGLLNGRS